ncbi:hypothetical protein [Streptomyces sp. NPDC096132]|uniref:hypothetical protein n=1 Tax=Streptomyces sp. NPDC096132 TaxID=3366075 RepID=UPI003803852B
MSARETFEDRLLTELKREIEARGETSTVPVRRRLLTPRRVVVALTACAVVALAPVLMPGSTGAPAAYAVERHGDGSVTLTLKQRVVDRYELAKALSKDDIEVVEWGSKVAFRSCTDKPGRVSLVAVDKEGRSTTVTSWKVPVVLHPGDKVTLCLPR